MRIPDLGLLAVLIIGIAATDLEHQYTSNLESSQKLLSTLQKMHINLSAQIAELSHMEATENSEKIHLLQHYTAQRDNIEREIASIQSIDVSHIEVAAPRHILKNLAAEEKTVPSILTIFKKPKSPDQENLNGNPGYSLPYQPYYPGYGQQYQYPYNGQATKPDHPYPSNDLVQGTFPGSEAPNGNHHQQTFINREQPTQSYQTPPAEQVSLQVPQQYTPPPQVMIQPLAQPPQPDPQPDTQRTQPQVEPYRPQAVPQQYQSPAQFEPYRLQPQREPYRPQPEPYRPQTVAPQQQYQPQAQLDPYRPNFEEQPQVESLLRPQSGQNIPQLGATLDLDAQALQQSLSGQKQGVFVYYPNGIIDEEERERPTIADRFGQAFDRVGQVISSFTNRQTFRSSLNSNNVGGTNQRPANSPERRRVTNNRPRSNNEKVKVKPMKPMVPTDKPMVPTDKPIVATAKPMVPMDKPMMPTDRPIMATAKPMMPMDKPKMRWVSV